MRLCYALRKLSSRGCAAFPARNQLLSIRLDCCRGFGLVDADETVAIFIQRRKLLCSAEKLATANVAVAVVVGLQNPRGCTDSRRGQTRNGPIKRLVSGLLPSYDRGHHKIRQLLSRKLTVVVGV